MLETMGKRIKDKRENLEMTLADLGNKVNVQASTVRKWETGYIKDIRSDKIQKLADALGVTPAYLMGWDESRNVKVDNVHANNGIIRHANAPVTLHGANGGLLTKEEMELLRIYSGLSVKRRMRLLTTAMELEVEEASIE